MDTIENMEYTIDLFREDDIFICAFGYEERSFWLFNEVKQNIKCENILVLVFKDYTNTDYTLKQFESIKSENVCFKMIEYSDCSCIDQCIEEFVVSHRSNENTTIHIDYSSMQRSCYCKLPEIFKGVMRKGDRSCFWYVEGKYPDNYEEYPSAGIESFSMFSGKPSLRTNKKRVHILSLGYDKIRTQAMISILDPDSLIVCNAYNSNNKSISENVKEVNREIIAQARAIISLQLDDFSFMISKLCELAYEYQPTGDVVFIPDGPKPLIMAISMVPNMVDLVGVTCLHISRNSEHFNLINVKPKENILGFMLRK